MLIQTIKKIGHIFLICGFIIPGNAQNEKISGGGGHFRAGYANYNMSSMNNWLSNVYPGIRKDFVSFGGSGYAVMNDLLIGGEGFGLTGATVSKDTLSITPLIGMGMLNIGYVMYEKKYLLIYPMLGVGGGDISYKFREVDAPEGGMRNIFKDSDYRLRCSTFLLSVAIGADKYAIKTNNKGISIGLKIGYTFAIQNGNWRKGSTEISGPNLNLSGFFATIAFGGGRLKKDANLR